MTRAGWGNGLAAILVLAATACVDDHVAPNDLVGATDLAADLPASDDLAAAADLSTIVADLLTPVDLTAPPSTWTEGNAGLFGATLRHVAAANDDTVYVSTANDVYSATGNGAFVRLALPWSAVSQGIAALAANQDGVYVAPTSGGVFAQTLADPSATFVDLTDDAPSGVLPDDHMFQQLVAAHGATANNLVFAANASDVYVYDPASPMTTRWQKLSGSNNWPAGSAIYHLAVDDTAQRVYVNNGQTLIWDGSMWQLDAHNVGGGAFDAIGTGTNTRRVSYFSSAYSFFNATAWIALSSADVSIDYLSLGDSASSPDGVVGCNATGVYTLVTPTATTWGSPLLGADVACGGIARTKSRTTAHVATKAGLFSISGGTPAGVLTIDGLTGLTPTGAAWSPTTAGRVFLTTDHGVALSTDNGATWSDVSSGLVRNVAVNAISLGSIANLSEAVYVVQSHRVCIGSVSGNAVTWKNTTFAANDVVALPETTRTFFACGDAGVIGSNDAGATPLTITGLPTSGTLACGHIVAGDSSTIFVEFAGTIYRSTNADTTSPAFSPFATLSSVRQLDAIDGSSLYVLLGGTSTSTSVQLIGVGSTTPLTTVAGDNHVAHDTAGDVYVATTDHVYTIDTLGTHDITAGLADGALTMISVSPNAPFKALVGISERGSYRSRP